VDEVRDRVPEIIETLSLATNARTSKPQRRATDHAFDVFAFSDARFEGSAEQAALRLQSAAPGTDAVHEAIRCGPRYFERSLLPWNSESEGCAVSVAQSARAVAPGLRPEALGSTRGPGKSPEEQALHATATVTCLKSSRLLRSSRARRCCFATARCERAALGIQSMGSRPRAQCSEQSDATRSHGQLPRSHEVARS
jgi:hypothetical protein